MLQKRKKKLLLIKRRPHMTDAVEKGVDSILVSLDVTLNDRCPRWQRRRGERHHADA
jgi:hypothetical protein